MKIGGSTDGGPIRRIQQATQSLDFLRQFVLKFRQFHLSRQQVGFTHCGNAKFQPIAVKLEDNICHTLRFLEKAIDFFKPTRDHAERIGRQFP